MCLCVGWRVCEESKMKINLWINNFFQAVKLFQSNIPVLHQYLSCQLSPQRTQTPLTVSAQSPVLIQIISSTRVVATFKLKFCILIQCLYLLGANLIINTTTWDYSLLSQNKETKNTNQIFSVSIKVMLNLIQHYNVCQLRGQCLPLINFWLELF